MTNARELIDEGLVARLKTSDAIQKVQRKFAGIDIEAGAIEGISHLEMPVVIINTGNETNIEEFPGGKTRIHYTPEIVGYVYDTDESATELNALITETKKMLFSNRRIMNGAACVGMINGLVSLTTDRGRLTPYGAFSLTIEILFDYQTSTGGEIT